MIRGVEQHARPRRPERLGTLATLLDRHAQACRESGLVPERIERPLEPEEPAELGEIQQLGHL